MTRTLLIADGIAALLAGTGLALLIRPALLRAADREEAAYALRILGAMLFAAALFCAGFAHMFHFWSAR